MVVARPLLRAALLRGALTSSSLLSEGEPALLKLFLSPEMESESCVILFLSSRAFSSSSGLHSSECSLRYVSMMLLRAALRLTSLTESLQAGQSLDF